MDKEKIGTIDISEDVEIRDSDSSSIDKSNMGDGANKDPTVRVESNLSDSNNNSNDDGSVGNKFIAYFVIGVIGLLFFIYLVQFVYDPDIREGVTGAVSVGLDYPHDTTLDDGKYNGFNFVHDELWKVEIPGTFDGKEVIFDVEFYYSPWEMKDVEIIGDFGAKFANDTVIASFDSRQENLSLMAVANGQIVKMLQKTFGKNVIGACGYNLSVSGEPIVGCEDRPILNCSNTEYPLFYLRYAEKERVEFFDKCVIIEGHEWGLVKAAEAAMMKGYSILE